MSEHDFEAPTHPCPVAVGDEVEVCGMIATRNSSGGTEIIERSEPMRCRVTKAFWDYETGWRFHGTPVKAADVEEIRRRATTEFGPDWYRRNRPDDLESLKRAIEAERAFDPSRVFFDEHDIAPSPSRHP